MCVPGCNILKSVLHRKQGNEGSIAQKKKRKTKSTNKKTQKMKTKKYQGYIDTVTTTLYYAPI